MLYLPHLTVLLALLCLVPSCIASDNRRDPQHPSNAPNARPRTRPPNPALNRYGFDFQPTARLNPDTWRIELDPPREAASRPRRAPQRSETPGRAPQRSETPGPVPILPAYLAPPGHPRYRRAPPTEARQRIDLSLQLGSAPASGALQSSSYGVGSSGSGWRTDGAGPSQPAHARESASWLTLSTPHGSDAAGEALQRSAKRIESMMRSLGRPDNAVGWGGDPAYEQNLLQELNSLYWELQSVQYTKDRLARLQQRLNTLSPIDKHRHITEIANDFDSRTDLMARIVDLEMYVPFALLSIPLPDTDIDTVLTALPPLFWVRNRRYRAVRLQREGYHSAAPLTHQGILDRKVGMVDMVVAARQVHGEVAALLHTLRAER